MSDKKQKDVMSDVINDIASAVEEPLVEAETVAGVVEVAQAEAQAARARDAETIIIKFDDEIEAARAVRVLNKALRRRHDTIYQGALVSREEDEQLVVEDLRDLGFADLITGTAAIGYDLGRDSLRLARTSAAVGFGLLRDSARLLQRTALRAMGVGGSTLTLPTRRGLDSFQAAEGLGTAVILEEGETAVVVVADHETAAELMTDLVRSGGEIA